jgi:hypothetical protein
MDGTPKAWPGMDYLFVNKQLAPLGEIKEGNLWRFWSTIRRAGTLDHAESEPNRVYGKTCSCGLTPPRRIPLRENTGLTAEHNANASGTLRLI